MPSTPENAGCKEQPKLIFMLLAFSARSRVARPTFKRFDNGESRRYVAEIFDELAAQGCRLAIEMVEDVIIESQIHGHFKMVPPRSLGH